MSKIAFVFPGQGAQFSGMGKDLYQKSAAAKRIFDTAESLKKGIIEQCFNGTAADLSLTINTQPCIFTVSMATAASLNENGIKADCAAGFSSGEIAALTYAGAFSFEDGFRAVCKRAELMHSAAGSIKGGMAAVLRLDAEKVKDIAKDCGVFAVNFNCPGQTVVAGESALMELFCAKVTQSGGRVLPLAVSGAFHTPYMKEASESFRGEAKALNMNLPGLPVYANYSALPYTQDKEKNLDLVSKQIANPVLWQTTVENMIKDGMTEFIEMQPGTVLTGLISKIKAAG